MSPKAAKRTTRAPKSAREPKPEGTPKPEASNGQTVKLSNAIKKLEFLDRLVGRSLEAFNGAVGTEQIHNALTAAKVQVGTAIADARALPVGFRFGSGGGGFSVGSVVTVKEKHAPKYAGAITGPLTIKEVGPLMILVESGDARLAWIPRGHAAKANA